MTRSAIFTGGWMFVVILSCGLASSFGCGDDGGAGKCGDLILDEGEQCDDGNTVDGDGCSAECLSESFCGNSLVELGEECDDGNDRGGDGCSSICQLEVGCGDGTLDYGEQCDDDNTLSGDGCSETCVDEDGLPVCGNGYLEVPEDCDDGNAVGGDGCDAECQVESGCGDGVLDPGEECDDDNLVSGDGCSNRCLLEFVCGDGVCDTENVETCVKCPTDCCPYCGDGMLDVWSEGTEDPPPYADEECDDGNNVDGDGCNSGCEDEDGVPTCGNAFLETGEECDDGNTDNGDACSSTCTWEFVCGDDFCDTQNGETCRLCVGDCCPDCGDGALTGFEQCDGANLNGATCEDLCYDGGTLSCAEWCGYDTAQCTGTGPICGNQTVEGGICGEECDGSNLDGQTCESLNHDGGTLGCTSGCQFDFSGCGPLLCLPLGEAIRLQEASHMDPDYVAITNLSVCPTDVQGLEVQTHDGSLSASIPLPSQILQPGEVVYLVESSLGTGTDINLGYNIGWVTNDDGFVLLCQGSCSVSSNVVDVLLFGASAPALPSPLVFSPAAMGDIISNQAYVRSTFTGAYPVFNQTDWSVGTNTH